MTAPDRSPAEPSDLGDLTERVRRLEELVGERAPGRTEPADPPADTFWILDGLEQRVGPRAVAYAGSLVTEDGPVRWQLTLDSEHVSMPEGPSCLRDGASTIRAAIIDFTLSRATVQSENVLSGGLEDESIFDGHGESSFHPSMV